MTALDVRPVAPSVAPSVAARRANRVKSGRPLTAGELALIRDLQLENAYGAETVGDLDSYVLSLLGVRRLEAWEQRAIEEAEAEAGGAFDPVWWEHHAGQERVRSPAEVWS